MLTKHFFLFLSLSLCVLPEAKAREYQCYNPKTKKVVGKPFIALSLGKIDIAQRCAKEAPSECSRTSCTIAPKAKSGFF